MADIATNNPYSSEQLEILQLIKDGTYTRENISRETLGVIGFTWGVDNILNPVPAWDDVLNVVQLVLPD